MAMQTHGKLWAVLFPRQGGDRFGRPRGLFFNKKLINIFCSCLK